MNEQPLMGAHIDGQFVRLVDERTYERVVAALQDRCRDLVAFGRAHGLTDEMWDEWKAGK